jgi:hypothetical protein
MELVEAGRVGTVYVEAQDRWGTADRPELFSLLGILREHGTRLYDLRAGKDLTERDLATELLAFVGSIKSEMELKDIAYRSLRSRVNNFAATGSWPTGSHPYGYGKACYAPDGKLLWVWQPVNRARGQVFLPGPDGELAPGPENEKLPRKAKEQIIKLLPSNNPDSVRAVKLVFDLYARVGLSRRQISARLNAEGLKLNGGLFTHPDVTNILENPAYKGDTYFGKVQNGELHTFDPKGIVVEVKKRERRRRDPSECVIRENTHEALVDRETWERANRRLAAERERTSFAPRNPAYYLKQLFVCGHCGKGLTGRTETDPTTGKKTVIYICPSYVACQCNGHPASCGYQRITHDEAERLLLAKVQELNLPLDPTASDEARANLKARLARLGEEDAEWQRGFQRWLGDGIDALRDYLGEIYPHLLEYPVIKRFNRMAMNLRLGELEGETDTYRPLRDLPMTLAELRGAVEEAETAAAQEARRKVAALEADHKALTLAWARATDLQQPILRGEAERLEGEILVWRDRTTPLSVRIGALMAADAERQAEREKLLAEWPGLENREKGEALRRLFRTVTLFWDRVWHPASAKPTRPRKTNRPGRYRYTLAKDRIEWAYPTLNPESSS